MQPGPCRDSQRTARAHLPRPHVCCPARDRIRSRSALPFARLRHEHGHAGSRQKCGRNWCGNRSRPCFRQNLRPQWPVGEQLPCAECWSRRPTAIQPPCLQSRTRPWSNAMTSSSIPHSSEMAERDDTERHFRGPRASRAGACQPDWPFQAQPRASSVKCR